MHACAHARRARDAYENATAEDPGEGARRGAGGALGSLGPPGLGQLKASELAALLRSMMACQAPQLEPVRTDRPFG